MATISPTDAIADIFGLKLHGRIGKLAWATVHIAFLVGWGNRVARWAFLLGSRTRPERTILTAVHKGTPSAPCGVSDTPWVDATMIQITFSYRAGMSVADDYSR